MKTQIQHVTDRATSYRVDSGLYLVLQAIGAGPTQKPVERATHHLLGIDVSGSMGGDLPQLRAQLKAKLPSLLGEEDLISVVWFSGRGECDLLVEAERVGGLKDLASLNQRIDRWLRPVGLTGFKEPMLLAAEVAQRSRLAHPEHAISLLFMSDGADNQWSRAEILASVEKVAGVVDAAACIAYTYYADQPMLTAMAERMGGSVVLARDFASYAPIFEGALRRRPTGAPRVEVSVGDAVGGFVFALAGDDLLTFAVHGGKAAVPADLAQIAYLSPVAVGTLDPAELGGVANIAARPGYTLLALAPVLDAAYAAVALFGGRMQPKVWKPLVRALGDVRMAELGACAFGKQKVADFVDAARDAAFGKGRFEAGYDPVKLPRADAFTVLDLLYTLASDGGCRFFPDHPEFTYGRISRARVDASDRLTDDDIAQIEAAVVALKSDPTSANAAAVESTIAAIKASRPQPLKFITDPAPDGYEMGALVPNSESPNMSIRVRKTGTVDLRGRMGSLPALPDGTATVLPAQFQTFVYRTYSIIADGLVNVEKLPVRLSLTAWQTLYREGVTNEQYDAKKIYVLDIAKLPVLNETQVETLSAKQLFEHAYDLERVQAEKKVYDHYLKTFFPKVSTGFVEQYGETIAAWLKEQGITDGSGFSPRSVQAEPTDVRTVRKLEVSFAGLSNLPKVDDARAKMLGLAKGKQSAGGVLMETALREVEAYANQQGIDLDKLTTEERESFEAWLRGKSEALDAKRRGLLFEQSKAAFIAIVAPAWFADLADLGDISEKDAGRGVVAKGEMAITVGAEQVKGTVLLREVAEKI